MISMIDGFSGYNQVVVHDADKVKKTFIIPWRTLMYENMPFRLMNFSESYGYSLCRRKI